MKRDWKIVKDGDRSECKWMVNFGESNQWWISV